MNNIENIKNKDIREIITSETKLSFDKYNKLKYCPFCESGTGENKTSAFSVQTKKNIFSCFVCGKKGNAIEFIIYFKKLPENEAINYLINTHSDLPKYEPGSAIQTDLSKRIYAIKNNPIEKSSNYLTSRNIDISLLPKDTYFHDNYLNAVVFFDSENKLINKRIIAPEPGNNKVIQDKGSILKNALYDKVYNSKKSTVFLVEGVINALSLFPYSALAIFSTNNKFTDVNKLNRYLKGKNIVLAFDNDNKPDKFQNAGKECTVYYEKFLKENINYKNLSTLILPDNKDINDLLKTNELNDFLSNTDNYNFIDIDILEKPLIQNSKDKRESLKELGYYVKDSQMYIETTAKGGHTYPVLLSDCVFETLYRLNDEDGTRLIKAQQKIIKGIQTKELFEVKASELSRDKFKEILNKKGFGYIGTSPTLDKILMYSVHRADTSEMINTYGWQTDSKMFVWSNLALIQNEILTPNSIRILKNPNKKINYYLPSASPANSSNEDLKELRISFSYKPGTLDFLSFSELFYKSNKQNGSIGTMFFLNALFRDIVVQHLDFFPYLFLYGTAGGGKTSYAEFLTGLFGDVSKGVDLKNVTQAALSRVASLKRNTITYYKEYKTDALPFVEQYFKAGYDTVSRTITSAGNGKNTTTFKIESSGLLDSNFLPTNEEAVFSRMIILDFENANFTEAQRDAFFTLKDHKEIGLVQITKEVLNYRSLFENNFKDVYQTVLDNIKNGKMKHFKDRERAFKHVALMLTPYHIFNSVLKFPFDIETLEDIMVKHAEAQYQKLNEFKSTAVFWQSLAYSKQVLNKVKEFHKDTTDTNQAHYIKVIDSNNKTGSLYIKSTRLSDLHTMYVSYCKTKQTPFISFPELKSNLISTGYKPFIENPVKGKKVFNQTYLKSSYRFEYTINESDNNIIIDGIEYEL